MSQRKHLRAVIKKDDVVKLKNKRGTCLINERVSRTDRQIAAPQAQADTYLALVQIVFFSLFFYLLPYLSVFLSISRINKYLHIFITSLVSNLT